MQLMIFNTQFYSSEKKKRFRLLYASIYWIMQDAICIQKSKATFFKNGNWNRPSLSGILP